MSLKSVEMQIAVPRTSEVGRIQNEHHQRPTQDQQFLTDQQIKLTQETRKRSSGIDETANTAVRDDGKQSRSGQEHSSNQRQQHEAEEHQTAEHPYKGRHFDVSL